MSKNSTSGLLTAAALAAVLALPLGAQTAGQAAQTTSQAASQANPNQAQTPASAQPASETGATAARAPLTPPVKQGFWGRLNPFARKKYVEGQLSPIRDRTNELDGLTADNAKAISDLSARNKAGIADAEDRAQKASSAADAAQQQVQQTSDQANQLNTQVSGVNTKVQGIDQYQVAQSAELHFKPGPAKLNPTAEQQLDGFLNGLNGQQGYVVEVTAYSSRRGAAGVAMSQQLADTVVRYMVLQHNIPLYRIYTVGMGNAVPATAQMSDSTTTTRSTSGGTVQIKILKNSLAGQTSPSGQ